MALIEGTGPEQYEPTIEHIQNGEQGNQENLSRATVQLEHRTDALKNFTFILDDLLKGAIFKADKNEQRIVNIEQQTTASDLATHIADDSRHTVYASAAELRTGTETEKVISPATFKTVTDERIIPIYDAIVGDPAIAGVSYSKLIDAVNASSPGWKILVTRDEFVDSTINITNDNIEIEFRRGASLLQGGASTALNISGNDCYIDKGRFVGFAATAINVQNGTQRTVFRDLRFSSNTANITNLGTGTSELGTIVE